MPFYTPWSRVRRRDAASVAQYHWGHRARFSPDQWGMDLAVFFDGELVGSQGFAHGTSSLPDRRDRVLAWS